MKFARLMNTSTLSLTLGLGAAFLICGPQTYAQQRDEATQPKQQAEPSPQEQESRPEASKPDREEMKPSRPENAKTAEQPEDRTARSQENQEKQQDKNSKQDAKQDAKQNKQDKKEMQQRDNDVKQNDSKQADRDKMGDNKSQHAAGTRIPDDKFRSHFGREHTFKVRTNTSGGRPQFAYGGYNFTIVEAWPAEWAYTDDCYVDYIDGEYFLFDLAHPGIRIAVIVL